MKKTQQKTDKTTKSITTAGVISVIVALIACLGTFVTALFGYIGLRYQADKSINATESTVTQSQLDTNVYWLPCSSQGFILPENVLPKQNSYNTLIQYPDFNDWISAPVIRDNPDDADMTLGKIIYAQIVLGNNSDNNGSWTKIDNRIKIDLDLVSPNVSKSVNLVDAEDKCGGGQFELFSPVTLDQQTNSASQIIVSTDSDFFSIEPGMADVFLIGFVCNAPGVYQASATLSVLYSNKSENEHVVSFGKILCPESYTLWHTYTSETYASDPLENQGTYFWNGNGYTKNP